MHSTMWEQQQKKIKIFPRGNLIVIHHLIADDKQIDSLLKLNSLYRDYILHNTFLP